MEKDNILLVASSTSDPARLEVHLNDHTQTLDGFSLSILEINFPGEVIFFSPGVDYIEIKKTMTNKNRKKIIITSRKQNLSNKILTKI